MRKVVEKGAGREERIYLGGFEIFRRYNGAGLKLERETLHVMDDKRRIALVETKTFEIKKDGTGGIINSPKPITRYQLDNHLGSAVLELDETGKVISYEEYHPYGTTSYQARDSAAEVSLKRYRYTGKEQDEESGFYYHGARYYSPWLGRWINTDPIGLESSINPFRYAKANPCRFIDPNGTSDNDWSDVDKVRQQLHEEGTKLQLQDTRQHPQSLKKPMSKKEARKNADAQAAQERKSAGMTDSEVQAGHTAASRNAPESGIRRSDWDAQKMQHLHSRKGKGLDVTTKDQSDKVKVTTRHRSQEGLIDQEVAHAKAASGGKLTPQGQLDAADAVVKRTENVPLDQRNVELLRKGGPAKPEPGPPVDPKTGKVMNNAVEPSVSPKVEAVPPKPVVSPSEVPSSPSVNANAQVGGVALQAGLALWKDKQMREQQAAEMDAFLKSGQVNIGATEIRPMTSEEYYSSGFFYKEWVEPILPKWLQLDKSIFL